MRAFVVVVALFGCRASEKQAAPSPTEQPAAHTTVPAPAKCENLDLVLVSKIVGDAAHPCRARVDAAYGRMISTGLAFSGTLVSTRPARGAGLFVTCQHCAGAGDGLREPEQSEPSAFQARAPAQLTGRTVRSGRETQLFFIYRLYSPAPPKSAFDAKGNLTNIHPEHDFVVGTVSGAPIEVVGHIGALPSPTVSDQKLPLHDPRELAGSRAPWAEAKPTTQALVMGFPRDLPDHAFGGELVASIGEILDDARAKDMLSRADADEAAIPYDPAVEMIIAARASAGMSGGGAFDEDGRYLGVAVRGTLAPVDGKYLVRVVRAAYVLKQLAGAVDAAPDALRAKLQPFLLP